MDYQACRRESLSRAVKEEGLDVLLVSNPRNVAYLTGFSGDSSYLLLGIERTLLVSDGRFAEQIAEECPGLEARIRPHDQPLPKAAALALDMLGFRKVGFESGHLTVAEWENLRQLAAAVDWKGGKDRVEKLRAVKDPSEVAEIREAVAIAERAFSLFRAGLRPEHCEKELSDAMEGHIRRAGGCCASFPSIVAAGSRAALAHAPPTAQAVGEAELLLVDWGASGRFYKSDLTRVLAPRRISPKLEKVHALVRRAQEKAIAAVRPGVKTQAVDAEARSLIEEGGFGEFFGHGLGHGLGLDVHEAPAVRKNSDEVLQAGMVFTVEPGIYLPGWGGVRIEDDVLVTPDGCEVLTRVPKELTLVFGA